MRIDILVKSDPLIKIHKILSLIRDRIQLITICVVLSGLHSESLFGQDQPGRLYPILFNYARNLYPDYKNLPEERRRILEEIADYVYGAIQIEKKATVLIIGTNNASRSIMTEAWAYAAAHYYHVRGIEIFSGGTVVSRISSGSLKALEKAGFIIYKVTNGGNPHYEIKYSYNLRPITAFSKLYNGRDMPHANYGAVFVCSNADQNTPFLGGMNFRTSLHYFDPIAYDNTPEAGIKYDERCREIATEIFYLFYCLKNKRL
jgi:protein-tyrosine phosphatase/arsenate reductase